MASLQRYAKQGDVVDPYDRTCVVGAQHIVFSLTQGTENVGYAKTEIKKEHPFFSGFILYPPRTYIDLFYTSRREHNHGKRGKVMKEGGRGGGNQIHVIQRGGAGWV